MNVIAILGHTASGKSLVAEAVASHFTAEIVSVDSMQVYRGMDIGTAKPSLAVRTTIPHHMIDIVEPEDDFDVVRFQTMAREAIAAVLETNGRVVISGGSGLHYRVIVDPYSFAPTDRALRADLEDRAIEELVSDLLEVDADAGDHVDLANSRRVVRALEVEQLTGETPSERASSTEARMIDDYEPLIEHAAFGLDAGSDAHHRSDKRFDAMIDQGLLDEVRSLHGRFGRVASQAVGYQQLIPVIEGSVNITDGTENAKRATKALIKRQRTFFRRDPRISWLPWQDDADERIASVVDAVERATQWTS